MILLLCASLQGSHYIIFLVVLCNTAWAGSHSLLSISGLMGRPQRETQMLLKVLVATGLGFLMLTLVVHYPLFSI